MTKLSLAATNSKIRMLERKVNKNKLRIKQLIVLLKLMLDKYHRRASKRKISVNELIGYMDRLIKEYYSESNEKELFDMIIEEQSTENIGVNPNENKT